MVKKFILVCDLCEFGDELEATETVALRLDGYGSKLDVCSDHKKEVVETMLPIMEAGRETGEKPDTKKKKSAAKTSAPVPIDPEQSKHIRAWATENGMNVNPRGRIRQDVLDAYNAAH